jgi:hypothetical protein
MLLKALCFTVPWAIDSIRVHLELRRYDADGNMVLSLGTAGGCNESTGIGGWQLLLRGLDTLQQLAPGLTPTRALARELARARACICTRIDCT